MVNLKFRNVLKERKSLQNGNLYVRSIRKNGDVDFKFDSICNPESSNKVHVPEPVCHTKLYIWVNEGRESKGFQKPRLRGLGKPGSSS